MKKYIFMLVFVFVCVFGIPRAHSFVFALADKPHGVSEITLKLTESGETLKLSPTDYLTGCLFAQIPVDYPKEALCAQASAAYTYALKLLESEKELSDDTAGCQPFFTEKQATEYYGDSYAKFLPAVKAAAEYGATHIITYKNSLIFSVYHSVSAGVTNRPQYVWGRDFPYLSAVESKSDTDFLSFDATNEYTVDDVRIKLMNYDAGIAMPVDYNQWFTDANIDENGYVLSILVGDKTLSGGDVWRILGLRSTAFTISYNGSVFVAETKGCGHGCGLSQYGAKTLAEGGATAEQILEYYYTDAEVVSA